MYVITWSMSQTPINRRDDEDAYGDLCVREKGCPEMPCNIECPKPVGSGRIEAI